MCSNKRAMIFSMANHFMHINKRCIPVDSFDSLAYTNLLFMSLVSLQYCIFLWIEYVCDIYSCLHVTIDVHVNVYICVCDY
jgi:hypothetical protein